MKRSKYNGHDEIDDAIRLNKLIAERSIYSRRKADELIMAGRVRINGELCAQPGMKVKRKDQIFLDGEKLDEADCKVYIMLNKPIHVICTAHDPQGRKTIYELLPPKYRNVRLFSVGRLDYFSEGLLLLTNDGALAQRLSHPRHQKSKIYEVLIRDKVEEKKLEIMSQGMALKDGQKLLPVRILSARSIHGDTLVRMELKQGINRQIRKMCDQLALTILRLRRIGESGLSLGDLPVGKTRELTPHEIELLNRN